MPDVMGNPAGCVRCLIGSSSDLPSRHLSHLRHVMEEEGREKGKEKDRPVVMSLRDLPDY